jgi:membrane carboxypeptidase/penicillin-binding protein
MENVDGITGAAPIWHDYMEGALAGVPAAEFPVPAGVTTARVCSADGGIANPWDTNAYMEVFKSDAVPTKPCASLPKITLPNFPSPDAQPDKHDKHNHDQPTPIVLPAPSDIPPPDNSNPFKEQ